MSSGLVSLSEPRGALPTAVRKDVTITASFIIDPPILISETHYLGLQFQDESEQQTK
jgi:hypothetical protein